MRQKLPSPSHIAPQRTSSAPNIPTLAPSSAPKRSQSAPKRGQSAPKRSQSAPKRPKAQPKRSQSAPLGRTDLKALQSHWYKILADTGFKDIELHGDGLEPSRNYLNGTSLHAFAKTYDSARQRHFERCRNFLTHCPNWASRYTFYADAARAYTDATPYHIVAKKHGTVKSEVFKAVQSFLPVMALWNVLDPEGLDFPSDF